MAQVFPFRAFRYNPAHAKFEDVLTQPYDKISPVMQEKYYAAHPHNLIAVEKGRVHANDAPGNDVYTRAAAAIDEWIHSGTVVQDPAPAFYGYTQEYTAPDTGEKLTRRGFIGAGQLEEYSAGVVYRHEHTLSGPKADRLELLRNTRMHTGQLFMIYSDAQKRADKVLEQAEMATGPAAEVRDEYGVMHRLWVIAEPEDVKAIQEAMADQKLVIADGHHRYETALNYRNERRTQAGKTIADAPYERAMMTFINTQGTGLTILPTHRVVGNLREFNWVELRRYLEPWFTAETIAEADDSGKSKAREEFLRKLQGARAQRAIGVFPAAEKQARAFYVLKLRDGVDLKRLLPNVSPLQRELDVVLLHEGILEPGLGITPQSVKAEANLTYERDAAAAIDAVDSGKAQVAFFLNACGVEQVVKIATAGEVMPQKSTDFYPKLMSGITMYSVDGERGS
ncbi:MAG: DUF1015 domain-containing protein [Acidobacteriota bacterium]|nr:DUF1015 domain-containing protein [Acidobacteriota bacterium]